MKYLPLLFVLIVIRAFSDEVYLRTGFVVRNVQIVDSTSETVRFMRDGKYDQYPTSAIARIIMAPVDTSSRSRYEMYSKEISDSVQSSAPRNIRYIGVAKKNDVPVEYGWFITVMNRSIIGCDSICLMNDSLVGAMTAPGLQGIPVDSLYEIRCVKENYPFAGTAIGLGAGVIVGLIGYESERTEIDNNQLFAIHFPAEFYLGSFGVLGGLVGLATSGVVGLDDIESYEGLPREKKIEKIQHQIERRR